MKKLILTLCLFFTLNSFASYILIPMDAEGQKNHLKAYGITYWVLDKQQNVKWLLNYRGGSFLMPLIDSIEKECLVRGVSYEILSNEKVEANLKDI